MNPEKIFELGLIVGRFQTLHSGHEMILQRASELCREVCLFIGSSQESGTNKNPFSYELRKTVLENVIPENVNIYPLPDIGVGNVPLWGRYVLDKTLERTGRLPDILVSGKEQRRIDWFDEESSCRIAELYLPKTVEISGTQMREFLEKDDRKNWEKYSHPKNYPLYHELRALVLSSRDNHNSASV